MAGFKSKVEFTHPEAKLRAFNPYFSEYVLSQQQLLPVTPQAFSTRLPDPIPDAITQPKLPKAKTYKKPREKKRPAPRPAHSKEVYEFLDL
jgi:hypothetical protein